jgi:hypothetical protein
VVINQILTHLERILSALSVPLISVATRLNHLRGYCLAARLRRRLDYLRKPTIQIVGCNDPTARYLSSWCQELSWNRSAARKHPVADGKSGGIPRRSG